MNERSYEHFSRGDLVRVKVPFRTPVSVSGPDAFRSWVDHEAGQVGRVKSMTNAGFRGLEYSVDVDGVYASGISAADLELVEAVDVVAWHGQGTYRDGVRLSA